MITKLTFIFSFFITLSTFSQDKMAEKIVAEGKLLYQSEMASWYGTDLFLESYKDRSKIGGYFSYSNDDNAKCIFFSNNEKPTVIGTITFDKTFDIKNAKTNLKERKFNKHEKDLYTIRTVALNEINKDTLFKQYQNTNLNLIPLINKNEKKVYVLTGPKQSGVVIFGNDYLIHFNKKNNVSQKTQLHKNIIPIYYGGKEEEGKQIEGAMHSHLPETGDYITATDICTLMLYEKFAQWKTHVVVSQKYINTWNCLTDELEVKPLEEKSK